MWSVREQQKNSIECTVSKWLVSYCPYKGVRDTQQEQVQQTKSSRFRIKYTLAISVSQGAISSLQVFRASFGILPGPSTVLFKRQLMVLAISLVIILLLTLRQVTGVSPVILLRSARAGQGENLSIRIFAFLLLSLIASNSPILYIGGRYRSSTRRPAFFFTYFAIF